MIAVDLLTPHIQKKYCNQKNNKGNLKEEHLGQKKSHLNKKGNYFGK